MQNLRYALRMLKKQPGFTVVGGGWRAPREGAHTPQLSVIK
jgi:hypothetical protein